MTLVMLAVLAVAPAPVNAIIWGGAKTEAEGRALFDRWPRDEARWSQRLRLASGFPRLTPSAEVPGLNPGFHVVLLGFCNAEQVRPRTRQIKETYPHTYWRPVKSGPAIACPEVLCGSSGGMIAVAPGEFTAGCVYPDQVGCVAASLKLARMSLPAFEIDRTEVTNRAFAACVDNKACKPPSGRLSKASEEPALVSYPQAWAYCGWQGKRVVGSLEWEKAARGTDGRPFPWGGRKPDCSVAQFPACGEGLKPVGSFSGGASPYGVLDLLGNAEEWVDGTPMEVREPDGRKTKWFPRRGEIYDIENYGSWKLDHQPPDQELGFRCARACTWPEGRPIPELPAPLDVAEKVDPAYERLRDPKVREALEKWRVAREAELGEGARVEWTAPATGQYASVQAEVREHRKGGECFEGPIGLLVEWEQQTAKLKRTWGGAVACCEGSKCAEQSPEGYALRFVEALRGRWYDPVKRFVPPRGALVFRFEYNGEAEKVTRIKRANFDITPLDRARDIERERLSCDEAFGPGGRAHCNAYGGDFTLEKTTEGVFAVDLFISVTEGC